MLMNRGGGELMGDMLYLLVEHLYKLWVAEERDGCM